MDKILSDIKQRVLVYLEKQGIKKSIFFKETGISPSNFKGAGVKSELGGDKIVKILTIYKDINPEWLLTGKGDIMRTNVINKNITDLLQQEDINVLIKYLLDNNTELMQNQLFRKYIEGNIRLLQLEEEKVSYEKEMQKLKEIILKKSK
ncbi:hypothetical protein [Aquimarina sp. I32.4]|uniref:hypothetical protein n=1 Tax=Aquimarina sp. I32.4 TaxID=2053903 RepID=UPI000CDE6FEE|nr:hypothetical protein [Aquimarina sp. I32.4]